MTLFAVLGWRAMVLMVLMSKMQRMARGLAGFGPSQAALPSFHQPFVLPIDMRTPALGTCSSSAAAHGRGTKFCRAGTGTRCRVASHRTGRSFSRLAAHHENPDKPPLQSCQQKHDSQSIPLDVSATKHPKKAGKKILESRDINA